MKKQAICVAIAAMLFSACNNTTPKETKTEASLAKVAGIEYCEHTPIQKEGKSVLVISSSARRGGNTDLLADAFVKGATEAGGKVEKIFLADCNLDFLSEAGANKPRETGRDSETWKLVEKFLNADVVCLCSPTYYMNVNDRMKTFIDATHLGFGDERMGGKEYYYVTACAYNDPETAEWCFNGFRGFVMCLPKSYERGYVAAYGIGAAGAVAGTQFETQAYELGKTINQ